MLSDQTALVVVDFQNDFVTGSLAVPGAEKLIPVINSWIRRFMDQNLPVYFTRDWHPEDHMSFKERGGLWPVHCVQDTWGAEIHEDIVKDYDEYLPESYWWVEKGTNPDVECYSAFCSDDPENDPYTFFEWLLEMDEISHLYVCGLAMDYCVKATVLDALKKGYNVTLLLDGIGAVNIDVDDGDKAKEEMTEAGASFI